MRLLRESGTCDIEMRPAGVAHEMLEEELARSGQIDEATKQRRKERQQQALREQLQGYLCK